MTQSETVSELEQQLAVCERAASPDVLKQIDILNDLAWALSDTDLRRAYDLGKRAYELAAPPPNNGSPYPVGQAYGLRTMGYVNLRLGDYPLGLKQLFEALPIIEPLEENEGLADVYDGITGIYHHIGNYPEALDVAYRQLKAAQRAGDMQRVANANNNLSAIYFETGDQEKSKQTLQSNLQIARDIGHARIECLTYINLAYYFLSVGEDKTAVKNGLRGLQISREQGYEMFEIHALHILGRCYKKTACHDQALAHLEEAADRSRALGTKVTEILVLQTQGEVFRDMRQAERAKECLNDAITLAHEIDAAKEEYECHLLLSEIFEEEGESDKALFHFKQYQTLKEQVANDKADLRLKILKVTHDTETARREAEIARLQAVELQHEVTESGRARRLIQRQLDYVQALGACSQTLLLAADTTADQMQVLEQALEHLRIGTGSSRAYIFRTFEDPDLGPCLGIVAEAKASDIATHDLPVSRRAPWTRMPIAVFEALQAGKPIGGPVETLFADLPDELAMYRRQSQPLLSLLCVPVFLGNRWWGFVGLDDCVEIRHWDDQEIRMLSTAAEMIANTLQRWQTEQAVNRQFAFARALSAFKQELLASAETEADQRRILSKALQHLLEPTRVRTIVLHQNFDDPEFGLSGQLFAVANNISLSPDSDRRWLTTMTALREFIRQRGPATAERSEELMATVFPWALTPVEITDQLADGQWVGGPVSELYANAPAYLDFLLTTSNLYSLLMYPIMIDGTWWGTISTPEWNAEDSHSASSETFLNEATLRNARWTDDEILLFATVAEMLASTLQRWQVQNSLRFLNAELERQVDARTSELMDTVSLLRTEVDERKRAEASLQDVMSSLESHVAARTEELSTFFDLILMAGQGVDLTEIFEFVVPRVMEFTKSQSVVIDLVENGGDAMNMIAAGGLPEEAPVRIYISQFPPELKRWMQRPNEPLLVADLAQEIPTFEQDFNLRDFPYQTYLGVQIRVGDRIDGILSCFRTEKGGYSIDEVALVTAVAQQLGLILETDHLRQQAQDLAVLEERERLARDLHDSVTQSLYSLSLFSRAGREAVEDGDSQRLMHVFTELEQNTLLILRELRLMLYDLRPPELGERSLAQAIEYRLNAVERRAGLQFDVAIDDPVGLSPADEGDLFYIVLEGLNNVVKHAEARHASLRLTQDDGHIHLLIADDGQGFNPQQSGGGLGLRNMRERVSRLGGQLTICSDPGSGTKLEVVFPHKQGKEP